jgi:hypothetical protein
MALALPRIRLATGAKCRPAGPDSWPGGCRCSSGDMMIAFSPRRLEDRTCQPCPGTTVALLLVLPRGLSDGHAAAVQLACMRR